MIFQKMYGSEMIKKGWKWKILGQKSKKDKVYSLIFENIKTNFDYLGKIFWPVESAAQLKRKIITFFL